MTLTHVRRLETLLTSIAPLSTHCRASGRFPPHEVGCGRKGIFSNVLVENENFIPTKQPNLVFFAELSESLPSNCRLILINGEIINTGCTKQTDVEADFGKSPQATNAARLLE